MIEFDFTPDDRVLQVGITGGIGTGKTFVCNLFAEMGVPVFDADSRAKLIYTEDLNLKEALLSQFGTEAYHPDGRFNREWMASQVFGNDLALTKLNELVHPAVFNDYKNWVSRHLDAPYLVKEAALMFESKSHLMMHKIIAVTAPLEVRLERILKRDPNRSKEQILSIIQKQLPEDVKCQMADYCILNDGQKDIRIEIAGFHEDFLALSASKNYTKKS